MTQPVEISISLGSLVDFVSARPARRISVVQGIAEMYSGNYDPVRDFYKQIREAIRDGLLRGDDVEQARRVVAEASWNKRANFMAVADGWETWRRRKSLDVVADTQRWHEQRLEVRVSPVCVWRHGRQRHLVLPYFKEPELSADAAQAATYIVEQAFGRERGTAAVLDIRRGHLHTARNNRPRNYDVWLAGEVSAMLQMFHAIRGAA